MMPKRMRRWIRGLLEANERRRLLAAVVGRVSPGFKGPIRILRVLSDLPVEVVYNASMRAYVNVRTSTAVAEEWVDTPADFWYVVYVGTSQEGQDDDAQPPAPAQPPRTHETRRRMNLRRTYG